MINCSRTTKLQPSVNIQQKSPIVISLFNLLWNIDIMIEPAMNAMNYELVRTILGR